MSYLDQLSPPPPPKDDNDDNNNESVKWKPASGGIPTGRGPEASYLQNMSAGNTLGSNTEEEETTPPEEEKPENPIKLASWSAEYLTDFLHGDDSRTDVRNLLTQRSLQSFMFLLEECRDPHSAKWLAQDFLLEKGNLVEFHGTGAAFIERFGGRWDQALLEMISRPKERLIVSAKKRGRGHGGWSKHNPYLKERWMELPIDIYPSSLCDRILSVREQIAREWVQDLDVLMQANDQILDSYFAKVRASRDVDPGGTGEAIQNNHQAFERTAVHLMNDQSRFAATASSPFRRSSFDLLYTLCTQAAIHRILREYIAAREEHDVAFVFLKTFYTERAVEFFDGYLTFGRADEFIDELLQTSPALLTTPDGRRTGLVDPLGTAEAIIRMRNQVALEWKETMRQVPEAHVALRQSLLSHQVVQQQQDGGSGSSSDGTADAASFQ